MKVQPLFLIMGAALALGFIQYMKREKAIQESLIGEITVIPAERTPLTH